MDVDNAYDVNKAKILSSLTQGRLVELEDPGLRLLVVSLTPRQIEWISSWLAGEGFHKMDEDAECYEY